MNGGALAVKVFPAGAYTPNAMRQLLAVGPFRGAKLMVSGGVSPGDAGEWFAAGAAFLGMGGGLVGRDLAIDDPPLQEDEGWEGMELSRDFFASLLAREPL